MGKKKEKVTDEIKVTLPTIKEMKKAITALNLLLKKEKIKLCPTGKTLEINMENFDGAIEVLDEEISAKLPEFVIDFYNQFFGDTEEADDQDEVAPEEKPEKKKEKAKKSAKKDEKPKEVSNEGLALQMIEDGKSDKDVVKAFIKRYKERGQEDKEYVAKRAAIYIHIAKTNLGLETTSPSAKKKEVKEEEVKAKSGSKAKKSEKKGKKVDTPDETEEKPKSSKSSKKSKKGKK